MWYCFVQSELVSVGFTWC
uniref:Uncharacterized protein n=1 Tax=Arundo donax TaxID=35708 RepID=A0A0A8Y1F4_ARUDO